MTQPRLFDVPVPAPETVNRQRDKSMQQVAQHAEEHRPGFGELAAEFMLRYLALWGPSSGEQLTNACKGAGLKPSDDRAFGPVLMTLARRKQIVKVGQVRREKGHGTAGANVWSLT